MSPRDYIDDLAEWELYSGNGLTNDIEIWLERYILDRKANGVSDKTVKAYREAISPFIEYSLMFDAAIEIDSIGAKYINNYLMWYQEKLSTTSKKISQDDLKAIRENKPGRMGRNDANFKIIKQFEKSLSHRLTVLKQLLTFISANNKEQHDYTRMFKYLTNIKVQKRDTKYLTPKELEELIAFMKDWPTQHATYRRGSEQNAYRDALCVLLYCLTGARSDEVLSLRLEDIVVSSVMENSEVHEFYIVKYTHTKGDKYRESAVHKEEIAPLVEYLSTALPDRSYYISSPFVSGNYRNRKMDDSTMYRFVNWSLKTLGIHGKTGRHIIRRGYATKELADGKDVAVVAMDLGHSSTETTFRHYLKNNPELMMRQKILNS